MNDIDKVLRELMGLTDMDRVKVCLSKSRLSERMDLLQDVLRDAIAESSLSMYCGKMYYFGGCIYHELSYDFFADMIYEWVKLCGVNAGDFCRVESIIRVCRRKVSTKAMEVNKSLVVFRNCVYDTSSQSTHSFDKKHVQLVQMSYDFNPNARGYKWELFLDKVLPNKDRQEVLQEFLGSLFIPRKEAKMETLMILFGNGSNGKSVVFDTIVGLLGRNSVSSFGLDELIGKGQERKRNIASINGKRLNYSSESRSMVIDGDSGTLKALISGEPIEARAMYGDNFTVDELPQFMINTNVLPELHDWTHGMRRRICIIPFEVEIPLEEQNKELSAQLKEEYPAIFNWVMRGRERFVANGYKLTDSHELQDLMVAYEEECNSVVRFMREMGYSKSFTLVKDASPFWAKVRHLYGEYMKWCGANHESLIHKNAFGRKLKEAGYKTRRTGGGIEYAIYGKESIRRLQEQNKMEAIALRRNSFYEAMRKHSFVKDKERIKYEQELGGKVACGIVELSQYLGYSTTAINSMDAKGMLAGTYKQYGIRKIFLLDAIDEKILPTLDEIYLIKLEKKKERQAKNEERLKEWLETHENIVN